MASGKLMRDVAACIAVFIQLDRSFVNFDIRNLDLVQVAVSILS